MAKKLTTYIILFAGISLIYYLGGLIDPVDNKLLAPLLAPETLDQSEFWIGIILTTILTTGVAIVVGFTTRSIELAAASVFIPAFGAMMFEFIQVFNTVRAENLALALILISVPSIVFLFALWEAWRGTD